MGHYNELYEEEQHKQKIWQDSLRKMKIEHLRESFQPELDKLDKELKEYFKKTTPTLTQEHNLNALKTYIDKRFDILLELIVNKNDR